MSTEVTAAPLRFNLCGNDIGAGLSRDMAILRSTLAPLGACEVSADQQFDAGRWGRALFAQQLFRSSPFAANLFLETVWGRWLFCAPRNWLIPNPEWLSPEHLGLVRQTDCVFCKTESARATFSRLGVRAEYVGFTSEDRWLGEAPWARPVDRALHIAGRSLQKGTRTLVEVWRRHPEWPELVVVQRPPFPGWKLDQPQATNITWIAERIPDEELRRLQNSAQIHISPSEAEGFGHVLVEALSCGVVLITTDGAPMNEIVRPDRGLLAAPWRRGTKLLGQLSLVDPRALEAACRTALGLSGMERERMGRAARAWYLENDARHRERLLEVVTRELA